MPERDVRERDILVAPNEYAYVQDLTKGDIGLYVGPTKISLSNTERLVEFFGDRFIPVRGEEGNMGVNPFIIASSSQYIILENPPKDANAKPAKGANYSIELLIGRKIVVPGPASFPLWPGQKAEVINGHELHEDQYLVVRVYDKTEDDDSPIGTERIIKGSEVSFYIPKTGLEVIPDEDGEYVRTAVTLLDGEYCILLAPNGKKKYFHGPAVVFPEPMEEFVHKGGNRIFRAHHLKKNMGLHIRVVKDYESTGTDLVPAGSYTAGQEIFLKDREGYFFPSENLEVLGEVYAIPLAEKEGIYVRDIETGRISTEIGPKNYLPDPTRIEIVARLLDPEKARLYGLSERVSVALQKQPAAIAGKEKLTQRPPLERLESTLTVSPQAGLPDAIKAISIYIPPSFAVLVTGRNQREVVKGPQTRILDYDEELEVLKLSMGKPKTDDNLLATCFLQTDGNKVSDIVLVKTSDHVELQVLLSYRVSFVSREAQSDEKWFNVKNYVGLLCDHLGSIVRGAVRATPIDHFHSNSTEVIRAAILGEKRGEGRRAGRHFEENNMWVYDVEVLEVKILDGDVNKLLSDAQRKAIVFEVTSKQEQMRLNAEKLKEEVNRQIYESQMATVEKAIALENARKNLSLTNTQLAVETDRLETVGRAQNHAEALKITTNAQIAAAAKQSEVDRELLNAKVEAFKQQMSAIAPELITTLKVLGDQHLTAELTRNLSPLAILGGESVAGVVERLLKGLPIGIDFTDGIAKALPQLQPRTDKE